MGMNESDVAYAQSLLSHNILEKIQRNMLEFNDGVIIVCCGDGDQFPDRFDYLRRLVSELDCPERPHFITRHGGALRLVDDSPLNKLGRTTAQDLEDEIAEAIDLKKIYTVLLEAHCKCGKCYSVPEMTLQRVANDLCRAAERVRTRFASNVVPMKVMHLDWGTQRHYYKFAGEQFQQLRHMLTYGQLTHQFPDHASQFERLSGI